MDVMMLNFYSDQMKGEKKKSNGGKEYELYGYVRHLYILCTSNDIFKDYLSSVGRNFILRWPFMLDGLLKTFYQENNFGRIGDQYRE